MPERMLSGLAPVFDPRATRVLVLGSFPSAASLEAQQYYAHPRNHFWPIASALLGEHLHGLPYERRIAAVRARGVGIWDVYQSCVRAGSLDADIRDAVPNDLAALVPRLPLLRLIAHNGGESAKAMRITRALASERVAVVRLPSTSPANASWSLARKEAAWRDAFERAGVIER